MSYEVTEGYTLPYPDSTQGPLLLRTVWVLLSISSVVVLGRIYSKVRKTRRLYWDDVLMLGALVFGFGHAITTTIAVQSGLGRHMAYLTSEERERTLRIGSFTLLWAFMSPMLGRIAFCVTLLFLSGTDPRVKKYPIWIFMFFQVAINVTAIVVFYTQCGTHLNLLWTLTKAAREKYVEVCENPYTQTDYGYFQGSFNTLTDAFLTALPAVLIEHTRLSVRAKIALSFLLCLSVLAMIASIVKTYEARALSAVLDYTWDLVPYVIWLSIELNVVMIVSSIPILRPLFQRTQHRADVTQLQQMNKWSTSTMNSVFSKKGARSNLTRVDSQENIIEPQASQYPIPMEESGIHVTHEVSVSYEPSNMPFVHAALVGLVQGEIANPRLARR